MKAPRRVFGRFPEPMDPPQICAFKKNPSEIEFKSESVMKNSRRLISRCRACEQLEGIGENYNHLEEEGLLERTRASHQQSSVLKPALLIVGRHACEDDHVGLYRL